MTQDEEKIIIRKVTGGDKDAFEVLVLENQKNVYNLALKMMRNADDALDIAQEAFIKAYTGLTNFRGESRFSVWLYKLTYNLCIDAIRKRPADKMLSLDIEDTEDGFTPIEIPDVRELPEDSAIRSETRKIIAQSIDLLPQKYREVLVMREITEMSYEEIAAAAGIDIGTVKSRLSRARLKLAIMLEKSGTFPDSFRLKTQRGKTGEEVEHSEQGENTQ